MLKIYEKFYLEVFEDFCILGFADIFDEVHASPRIEIQIILASKWPVDIRYRYITGSPTNRYRTVKSLESGLTAQSVPQPVRNIKLKPNYLKIR